MLATLALRNLTRNRRRTALSLLVVGAGGAALILTTGFVRESFGGLREALIRGGLGHLEIAPASPSDHGAAGPDRAAPPSLVAWEGLRASIESTPGVAGVSGVVVLHGLVALNERTLPFVGAGLEPDREERMGFRVRLKAGRDLPRNAPVEGEDAVLLGLGLAQQLGATVGDLVTLTVVDGDGMLNALDVSLVGTITTGVQDLDARFLRVHLVTAQRLLGTDAVSSMVVMLDDTDETDRLREAIGAQIGQRTPVLSVTDWEARAPFYGQVRALYGSIFAFLGSVVLVLVLLSSSNTLLMIVMERIREMGALLAIGTSPGQAMRMIVYEAGWLGIIGGGLGSVLAVALATLIHALHIELPPPPGAVDPMELRVEIVAWDPLWVTALMALVLVGASLLPAWRVARLRIAEALVHV